MDERRQAADCICARLRAQGYRALFAGGCVRDMLLGHPPKDYDIATDAKPDTVASLFSRTEGVGAAFGVQLVIEPEGVFEVATFRRDGPYLDGRHPSSVEFLGEREDALRRDFTVNALFFDPVTEKVIDYVDGQRDLDSRVIRTVGEPKERFAEDLLRLLRAVRFAARLNFAIDPKTLDALREMAPLCTRPSAERVRDELLKMLTEGGARRAFELMDQTGLLAHVLPEISRMKGVEQPPEYHPEGDVFTHTMMLLGLLDHPTPTLALGALLHDVGKPETITYEDRIRFNNHEKVGADMAQSICRRLRLSNDDTDRVTWLVAQHMRLSHIPDMRESKRKRFVREEGFDELLDLAQLDCMASHGDLSNLDWIKNYIAELKPDEVRPKPLINGVDLINMGFNPGPVFKEILQAIEDGQLEGTLTSEDEAREFIENHWPPAD